MGLRLAVSFALLAAAVLPGCASSPPPTSSTQGTLLVKLGEVTEVRDVAVHGGKNSGVGAFTGGVLGGIAGSSVGGGYGRALAGIGGAVAGSMAGQHIEQSGASTRRTELTVRFDDGTVGTYQVEPAENFRVGDPVTVTTGQGIVRVAHR